MEMFRADCWSDERAGRLVTLYNTGLSFSLIADDIGVSRNAVIGKAHRMHLPKRKAATECKEYKRPVAAKSTPKRVRLMIVRKIPLRETQPEVDPVHAFDYSCRIYELRDSTCRYPLWSLSTPHSDRFYCGVPDASLAAGVPYCRRHDALCGRVRLAS